MDAERVIYSLNIEDILSVIEENGIDIELKEADIPFLEDKVGEMIDWYGAIEYALSELEKDKKMKKRKASSKRADR